MEEIQIKKPVSGFVEFLRTQGVVGLAIGFLLGGAVSKVVTAFVTDIINPLVGAIFGTTESMRSAAITIGSQQILWGDFVAVLIDFLIIAAVVYWGFKKLGLEKLDKK